MPSAFASGKSWIADEGLGFRVASFVSPLVHLWSQKLRLEKIQIEDVLAASYCCSPHQLPMLSGNL